MMPEPTQEKLFMLTGAVFALAVLLLLVSWRLFRRSRRDVYWRKRREAGQRGWRLFVMASLLLALSGVLCAGTLALSLLSEGETNASAPTIPASAVAEVLGTATPTATFTVGVESALGELSPTAPPTNTAIPTTTWMPGPSPTPEVSPTPAPSATPAPTSTPVIIIVTPTPGASPTPTPYPTFTPSAEPVPLEPKVTPLPGARMTITALADQISSTGEPIQPRHIFVSSTRRIYLFVRFNNMTPGVLWKRYLYRDDQVIAGGEYLWGSAESGTTYFFFGDDSGFQPGQYEIRLYIGDSERPVSTASFTVIR